MVSNSARVRSRALKLFSISYSADGKRVRGGFEGLNTKTHYVELMSAFGGEAEVPGDGVWSGNGLVGLYSSS